jgi:glycoprotein endo-alpha-1,2-mannosidase
MVNKHIKKIYGCLISVALLLCAAINTYAADKDWTNGAGDRLWRTAGNWSGGIPTINDKAGIRNNFAVNGPIIDSGTVAEANQIVLGDWSSTSDSLEITGGTLTVKEWFISGYYGSNSGTITISSGTVNVGGNFFVGHNGTGTLNMTGGTITVGSTFGIAQQVGGMGDVRLEGGTISCGSLNMTSGGAMDITTGTLIVNGDSVMKINGYISSGWITAYGGSGTVNVDYDVTNPGKTTVAASTTPPVKATNPNPANGAVRAGVNTWLSWTAAPSATSHDIYFGTASPGTFRTNQTAATFNPGTLAKDTTYYWRIDEKNASGTTTGDVWSFTTASTSDYFVGVYYYPWYHENNFHGSGPTGSNTLVYYLNPQMTPQLGWYDQDDADISQHFKWARYAGIDYFVNSYWGSGTVEDHVLRNHMFNNPDRGDIKLSVFLEPSLTPVDHVVPPAALTAQINYLCDYYFNQSGYFRIDNKPVIFIYVTRAMTDPNLEMCISTIRTAAANKGIGDVYIVGDEVWGWPDSSPSGVARINQMDAVTNYDVYGNLNSQPFVTDSVLDDWQVRNAAWKEFVNGLGKQFIPAVSPGFNDRGVRTGHNPCSRKLNNESSAFGSLFAAMLDRVPESVDTGDMIMVTSWNEWHEDTQIEPAEPAPATNLDISGTQYYTQGLYYEGYGMRYLNILRDKTTTLALCDYDDSGTVGFNDLAFVLEYWLDSCSAGNNCIEADLDSSRSVDLTDFANCAGDWTNN